MKVTITQTEREFDIILAWRIIAQVLKKASSVIGLATGATTIGTYQVISEISSVLLAQLPLRT